MVIAYRGNFYEAKRPSHLPQEFELTRLLLENHDPSCEMLRFGRSGHQNLCQTLPFFSRGRESMPQAHIDFDDVRTPSEFSVIKISTRPKPVAAPHGRNV